MVYEKDWEFVPSHHNRPLYVKAQHPRPLYHGNVIVVSGSSLNIMPLFMPETVRIPRERIAKQLVGPARAAKRFHIVDAQTLYHLLMGRH